MRDYGNIVRRVEALLDADSRVLGEAGGYPIYGVRLSEDASRPVFFINGGTHGDEPAGVEGALAFLEADQSRWLGQLQFEVIPCLNSYGYVHETRLNGQETDINWAFLRNDVPEIDIIRDFVKDREFEAVVDLHEDWESPGYYLYEQFRGRLSIGREVTRRVSEVCPLNMNTTIENEAAQNGVIFPNLAVERRRKGEGIPIALFQQKYTDHLITSETPTGEPMARRVQAHLIALETIIEAHCVSLSGT